MEAAFTLHMTIYALAFAVLHAAVFYGSLAVWRYAARTRPKLAVPQLASSTMAGLHGLVTSCWCAWLLLEWDWQSFDHPNSQEQVLPVLYSAAYFVVDWVVYLIPFQFEDWIFQAHHAVTLLFLGSTLHLGRGAAPVAFGLLAGECTNPVFHTYLTLKEFAPSSPTLAAIFRYWAVAFTVVFTLVRSVLGPLIAVWFWRGSMAAGVPLAYRLTWAITGVLITLASQLFTLDFVTSTWKLWKEHLAERQALAGKQPTDGKALANDSEGVQGLAHAHAAEQKKQE